MSARRATRVLVIDDDTDVLGLLRALCHGAGVEILEAVDAQSGLALAREHAREDGLPLLLDIERAGAQVSLQIPGCRLPPTEAMLAELARLSKDGRA